MGEELIPFWFDQENRCFWFKPEKFSMNESVFPSISAMYEHPDYEPGMPSIWDLSGSNLKGYRSSDSVSLNRQQLNTADQRGNAKIAVIVGDDVSHGITRMHLGWSQAEHLTVEIFKDEESAIAWIRGE